MTMLNRIHQYGASSMRRHHQSGLSLIELMIAITLGLLILAGMVLVFANTSAARNEVERISRQIENGRYAIELLREDIQLAGFFGETSMQKVSLPGAIPNPCSVDPAVWPLDMKVHVQGVNEYAAGNLSCLPSSGPDAPKVDATDPTRRSDVIIVRRVKTCVYGAAGCDTDDTKPYLQVPLCSTSTETHILGIKATTTFDQKIKDCVTDAVLRPYVVYFFYVGNDNTLKRAEFLGSAVDPVTGTNFRIVSLVDGIENLQFDYGIDTNGDGSADTYQAAPASAAAWGDVVSVQINLLAQNTELSPGFNDTRIYNLGPSKGNVGPFTDARRRNVYSAMVRIVNPSGIRETP